MRLLEEIERRIGAEESVFLAQLMREDLARVRRLQELAGTAADGECFAAAGRRLGWTPGDQRTAELRSFLDPFLDAFFESGRGAPGADDRLFRAWLDLTRGRVDRLVGCLSTRVPKPEE